MAERKNPHSRYYRQRVGRTKDQLRRDSHCFDSIPDLSTQAFLAKPKDVTGGMRLVTDAFRAQMGMAGYNDPFLLKNANIFEAALTQLEQQINQSASDHPLYRQALEELTTLSDMFIMLFTRRIPLRPTTDNSQSVSKLEGYFELADQSTHRLQITQRLYTEVRVSPSSRFTIKRIIGRGRNGAVIAGSDDRIRLGLRVAEREGAFVWSVSVDSGSDMPYERADRTRFAVRPLSQVIYRVLETTHPEFGAKIHPYTFHYYQEATHSSLVPHSGMRFGHFNRALYQVIQSLAVR